uniref:VWA domain-containing protein n=1 Tax=candidate division WOR-3 bacterium TaxID=2052148 RepID=A0A7V3VV69_UNCW3
MIQLLISLFAVALSIILYYKRPFQLIIRIIAIVLIYLIISNVTITVNKRISLNLPVMLIDCSPSMKNYLKDILSMVDSLKFRFNKIFFSDSIFYNIEGARGKFTDITSALLYCEKLSPSAVVLISDGNHNYGRPPSEILSDYKTPVFCFATGNKELKDQAITDLIYPDYSFFNDTITIEVIIGTNGFAGGKGKVVLKSEDIALEKSFKLSQDFAQQSVEFKFIPRKPGEQRFMVSLYPQPGESNLQNNEYPFSITVFEQKIKVLYYTEHPSFNTRFIIEVLQNNPDIELSQVIKISRDEILTSNENLREGLIDFNQFDVVIFDNINGDRAVNEMKDFLYKKKGILFIGDIRGAGPDLNDILCFPVTGTQYEGNFQLKVLLPFSVIIPGKEYAPISKINRTIGINPRTTILAQADGNPVIGYREVFNGRVFQINISEIGVWHFAQLGLNNQDILDPLLETILRFLSPYGKTERLILKPQKNQYHIGEQMKFELKAYDQRLLPGSGGNFYLEIQNKKIPFFEITPGRYETTVNAEKFGEFTVFAKGVLDNDTMVSKGIKVNILDIKTEPEEIINSHLLEEIGKKTKGGYHEFPMLKDFIPPERKERFEKKKISFDRPTNYFIIFFLLALDWIIRKRGGMV